MKKCPFCAEEIQDAALVCKHCGRDLQGGASQVQLVQPKKKTSLAAWGCLVVVILIAIAVIAGNSRSPEIATSTGMPARPGAAPTAASATGKWVRQDSASAADDTKTVVLVLDADAAIQGWPGRRETPTLIVRCQEGKTETYINTRMRPDVESGHLDGATVLLRFDKEVARPYRAGKSTDGEALFLPGAVPMIRSMAQHDRMLFRFTPFNSPPQETTFDLRGLSTALPPLQKACGWS